MKPEKDWDPTEHVVALKNSRAINATYNGFEKNIYMIINTRNSSKEAYENIEVTHKGTLKVRMSRFQLLLQNLKT